MSAPSGRRAGRAIEQAWFQLREGPDRLRRGPSRFGPGGRLLREAVLRAARPLAVRQGLLDERVIEGLDALAFETAVAHLGASAFPVALDPRLVVEAQTDVGVLFAHRDDAVITPMLVAHGIWEPDEAAFLRRVLCEGATFLDVGANIGYFSVLASRMVGPTGQVIAVEPEERNLAVLKANLWRHACANAVVLPLAAASYAGFVPMRLNDTNRGDHQVGLGGGADALVPCARLDGLLTSTRLDVVKVDAQGYDSEVLAGLSGLIERSPDVSILAEFWLTGMEARGMDAGEVARGYERQGFGLSLLGSGGALQTVGVKQLCRAAEQADDRFVNVVLQRAVDRRPE